MHVDPLPGPWPCVPDWHVGIVDAGLAYQRLVVGTDGLPSCLGVAGRVREDAAPVEIEICGHLLSALVEERGKMRLIEIGLADVAVGLVPDDEVAHVAGPGLEGARGPRDQVRELGDEWVPEVAVEGVVPVGRVPQVELGWKQHEYLEAGRSIHRERAIVASDVGVSSRVWPPTNGRLDDGTTNQRRATARHGREQARNVGNPGWVHSRGPVRIVAEAVEALLALRRESAREGCDRVV